MSFIDGLVSTMELVWLSSAYIAGLICRQLSFPLLIVTAVSVGVYFGFFQGHIAGGLVLGVSLAFSSTILAVKVLDDSGELSTLYGRDVLSILILQDIVAIGLLALTSGKTPTPWALALLLIPLLRPIAHRLLNASYDGELKLLLGISLALAGGMLAEQVGISNDIGALLMGTMLAGHHSTEELSSRIFFTNWFGTFTQL